MKKGILIGITIVSVITTSFVTFSKYKSEIITLQDGFCGISNTAFRSGEQIQFQIFYSVVGAYILAGDATFTCVQEKMNNKPVYHIEGVGNSNSKYDFIFKVRDKYESWIDTTNFLPLKFNRKVSEGKFKKTETITFNHTRNKATSTNKTYDIPKCVQDVLSATYYARNINFDKMNIGDKVNFSMTIDDEIHNMYIKYMGKETVKTRYGKFNSIKFKPLLIKGTIFEGGEKMTVWVSDDANRLPLRVNSPITVGSVKVDMMGYRNLRYPLTSLISFNK
jgi:hypothetical protein